MSNVEDAFILGVWKQQRRTDLLLDIVMSRASYLHGGKVFQWLLRSKENDFVVQLPWQLRNYGSTESARRSISAKAYQDRLKANTLIALKEFRESVLDSTIGIASLFQQKTYAGHDLGSFPAWSPVTVHSDPASIEKAIDSSGSKRYGRYYRWPDVLLLGPGLYDTFARTHDAQKEKRFVYRGIDVFMEPGFPETQGYLFPRDALRARFMTAGAVDLEGNNVEMYFVLQFTQPRAFTRFKGITV